MKSILDGRQALKQEIDRVAEVAGYLWQNGWAERNGGNITVNITEFADEGIRSLTPIGEVTPIGKTLPRLKDCYFYCKGTLKRMRDLARCPMDNGSVIRILDDCASYVVVADKLVAPTSFASLGAQSPTRKGFTLSGHTPYTPHRTHCHEPQQRDARAGCAY